jgi:hypothetical protein
LRKGWLQIDFAIGLVLAFFTFLRSWRCELKDGITEALCSLLSAPSVIF